MSSSSARERVSVSRLGKGLVGGPAGRLGVPLAQLLEVSFAVLLDCLGDALAVLGRDELLAGLLIELRELRGGRLGGDLADGLAASELGFLAVDACGDPPVLGCTVALERIRSS